MCHLAVARHEQDGVHQPEDVRSRLVDGEDNVDAVVRELRQDIHDVGRVRAVQTCSVQKLRPASVQALGR